MTRESLLWLALGAAATATTVAVLFRKKPQAPSPPPPTFYGETTTVTLPVPAGWRRVTDAEVTALPELGAAANALMGMPGFTSMQYGTLVPFVASDGNTYATWIEQHYHPPGGAMKPWGLHHGVTVLAKAGAQ